MPTKKETKETPPPASGGAGKKPSGAGKKPSGDGEDGWTVRGIVGGLTKLGASGWLRALHDEPRAMEFIAAYVWAQEFYEGQDAGGLETAWLKLSVAERKEWRRRAQAALTGVNAWLFRPEEP